MSVPHQSRSSAAPMAPARTSLYANLLGSNTSKSASISAAPVMFARQSHEEPQSEAATKKQQMSAAALRFQPTKRPQITNFKAKPKTHLVDQNVKPTGSPTGANADKESGTNPHNRLAAWTSTAEDDIDVDIQAPSVNKTRTPRYKKRKTKEERPVVQNWDDIYDPGRPNVYEDYKNSEEKYRASQAWKDRLYAHRTRRSSSGSSSARRPALSGKSFNQFAPPPPSVFDQSLAQPFERQAMSKPAALPVPPIPIPIPETDKMDDGARASQMRLTYHVHESSATISREPVRYDLSQAPQAISMTQEELEGLRGGNPAGEDVEMEDISSAEAPRSNRPGQAGFAARLMAKYGWEKGSGLGASGGGILKPLQAKVEKQKKRSDAEGGGIRNKGRGTILAESRKDGDQSNAHGKFGPMSEVIVLDQMVDGLDVDAEMEDGLMQEIGEECGEKYGRVERVFIDRTKQTAERKGARVFIKFTSQLSGLRAVNALEGRVFNGNEITARFFDSSKFDDGRYD